MRATVAEEDVQEKCANDARECTVDDERSPARSPASKEKSASCPTGTTHVLSNID